jgi:hypothetical protein
MQNTHYMENTESSNQHDTKEEKMQDRFRMISSDVQRYVEKRIELVQLEIADRLSLWISRSIHKLFGLAFLVFSYVFFMMGLAHYLGPLLGHISYGYLIVAGLTALLGLTLAAVKPASLARRMRRSWLRQVFVTSGGNRPSSNQRSQKGQGENKKQETATSRQQKVNSN